MQHAHAKISDLEILFDLQYNLSPTLPLPRVGLSHEVSNNFDLLKTERD